MMMTGIHAREWVSVAAAQYFIYALIKHYDEYKDVIDAFQWHVLPLLNPDGYEYTFTHVS
jgi:murein tripeptide amidase MpaA